MGLFDRLLGRKTPPPPPEDDAAPGWDAIDAPLAPLYGEQEPQHWGTIIKWMLGGPDPLDGISAYRNDGPPQHWHFVSYGMTDLYLKESENPDVSGWGFEFTFRLARRADEEAPPIWAINYLQNLARYVFKSGNPFDHGHHIDSNGPIAGGVATNITAALFYRDPQLPPIDTPHGQVTFLQIVGITDDELEICRGWNTISFADLMRETNPLLVTDLARSSLLADESIAARVAEGQERDGSSSTGTFVDKLSWTRAGAKYVVTITAKCANALIQHLRGRILHGRSFDLQGAEQTVVLVASDADGVDEADHTLTVRLTAASARALMESLQPKRGAYAVMPELAIEVLPSILRTESGAVTEEIG
jgi:hypothetical protein